MIKGRFANSIHGARASLPYGPCPWSRSCPDPVPMKSRLTTNEFANARRYPVGVEIIRLSDGSIVPHARVWAPERTSVELVISDDSTHASDSALTREGNGYFSGSVANVGPGTRYKLRLDGGDEFPDPASRYQPEGPHGPSMVIDPAAYVWGDGDWRGASIE